jgi:hydroxyacylglutathione hydrolase
MTAWASSGRDSRSYAVADVDDLCRAFERGKDVHVLDVRQPAEWESGVVPGSTTLFVGDLGPRMSDVPRDREVWVICATGRRAAIAASLLDREGIAVRAVVHGGVRDWLDRCRERR